MMGHRETIKGGDEINTLYAPHWRGTRKRSPIKRKLSRRARREVKAKLDKLLADRS